MLKINILTLFPEFFSQTLDTSMIGRAQKDQVDFNLINIRDFATDKHHTTDDRPFGGGPGMVMKVEPIYRALKKLGKLDSNNRRSANARDKVILTSAKGQLFSQQMAQSWSDLSELTIICGHYQGVDERVAEYLVDEEIRIGNYVLTGGEPAALVMSDAVVRLIPGVLGNDESHLDESHTVGDQLSHPLYTRPDNFLGWQVPEVLLSGHHQKITTWQSEARKSQT